MISAFNKLFPFEYNIWIEDGEKKILTDFDNILIGQNLVDCR